MRILLNAEACTGHGRCYSLEPDLFDADEFGHCVVLAPEVPTGREDGARSAAANCPEHALTVEG